MTHVIATTAAIAGNEEDGFYYDLLRLPDGRVTRPNGMAAIYNRPGCTWTRAHGGAQFLP